VEEEEGKGTLESSIDAQATYLLTQIDRYVEEDVEDG
jgi:hypothetical protein